MDDLLQVFLEESQEIIEQLEGDLLVLEKDQSNQGLIAGIFRAAHTIKGSAGLTGLDDISGLAHRLEDILDQVRSKNRQMSHHCFESVLLAVDMLKNMIGLAGEGQRLDSHEVETLKQRLTSFLTGGIENEEAVTPGDSSSHEDGSSHEGGSSPEESPGPEDGSGHEEADFALAGASKDASRIYRIFLKFKPDIFESGTDPIRLIGELAAKGEILKVETAIDELPPLPEFNPYRLYVSWDILFSSSLPYTDIEDIFIFVLDDNEIIIQEAAKQPCELSTEDSAGQAREQAVELPPGQKRERAPEMPPGQSSDKPVVQSPEPVAGPPAVRKAEPVSTIRVDTRRLENVLNFIAELVITESRVKELVGKQSGIDQEVFNYLQEMDKIIRRLQEEVMKTSMVPIGGTFTRFQRMVRDLAADQGKEVELAISGQETELDKRVIEQITDPLKHMIRNSIDHGIERPDEREAKGKPRTGRLSLAARHQEGSILIEVADDGAGLNPEAIFRKAVEKGLVEENTRLSNEDMLRLIMEPGFSTAAKITDISGRGVGMDVAATNIQQLRGSLDVESVPGQGTKFLIKLPLTLAIIDGMMVTVGEERFILPLTSIVEFIKARPEDIKTVEGAGKVVNMRNEYLPLAGLHKLLGLPADKTDPAEGILVIIRDNRKKIALLVDDILGQEQVVTKSLKDNYEQVEGVAGATILGDGRVAIILDVPTLIKMVGK